LNKHFAEIADHTIPILRNSTTKYKKPCRSNIFSKSKLVDTTLQDVLLQLNFKKRVIFDIEVKLYDEESNLVLNAGYDGIFP
jgi:hypothetical protein